MNPHPMERGHTTTAAIGSISKPLTEFTCLEQLPIEVQHLIIAQAYQNDLAEHSEFLDIELSEEQPELLDIDKESYVYPDCQRWPLDLPDPAPKLFALYAVNSVFKKELDRLSEGRLTFVFLPDFKLRSCLDVVYFDPGRCKLRLHYVTTQPDILESANLLSKNIARDVKTVEVYCHRPNKDPKPHGANVGLDDYFNSSSSNTPIWSGIAKPEKWADEVYASFPNVRRIRVCWWKVYAAEMFVDRGDDDNT